MVWARQKIIYLKEFSKKDTVTIIGRKWRKDIIWIQSLYHTIIIYCALPTKSTIRRGANTSGQLSAIPLYLKKVPVHTKEGAFVGAVSRMNAVRLWPEAYLQYDLSRVSLRTALMHCTENSKQILRKWNCGASFSISTLCSCERFIYSPVA